MKAVTVVGVQCWGCNDVTLCIRFYGRSGHRRMDICLWCMVSSIELIAGVGIFRAMRQWMALRESSIELKGANNRRFVKVPERFKHE